ncbi:fork head domain-containing protein [Halteromyces radiatus]|uniref:fork head domain-containing protein n=1 Tax=Halteromyces radiatus TaxID=101107 RepID=UPI00221E773D|nr:fork head domain-containing protein [Halteromyces radiatus]XP_051405791.1 fork head domain-containing protein [Halteromyces radiatus]KAI8082690.1 fork head domain-containing protein [Halteromyces radiatus]KAI8100215.1 fork head domain-containing protein [Halteromyces radiatus]
MNFIRLPSLKLNHHPSDNHHSHNAVDSSSVKMNSLFLPPTWKQESHHYQQEDLGLKLHPSSQSYAQEMFSFSAGSTIPPPHANNIRSSSTIKRRRRPPHSYASMIAQAIMTSKEQKMTLRDIYAWVQQRYPHLYETNTSGCQNVIRHNLSLNRCFYKLPKSNGRGKGKGGYWAVSPEQLHHTTFGRHLLDTGGISAAGFEYWPQSSVDQKTQHQASEEEQEEEEEEEEEEEGSQMDEDNEGFIPRIHPSSISYKNNITNLLQPADLATLQNHQLHLQQRRSVPPPPALTIPFEQDHHHHHQSPIAELDNPTFHPPSLHHILN